MENLSLLMVTCELNLDIAKLTMTEFIKYSKNLEIKKYLTSNSFNGTEIFNELEVNLIDSNIPFCNGGTHFAKTVLNALDKIDSEYIFMFLDDMCLIKDIKTDNLKKIINLMSKEFIDFYSTSVWGLGWPIYQFDYKKYGLEENSLEIMDDSFQYMYSTQPCIWKKNSLKKLLEKNQYINVSKLDTGNISNLKGEIRNKYEGNWWETKQDFWDYGFKNICSVKNKLTSGFAFDEHNGEDDYFLLLYSEILRWGKFNFRTHQNNKKFLDKFLQEKKINENHEIYYKYF